MTQNTTLVIPADRFAALVAALCSPGPPQPSPALSPPPSHIDRPQNPLPGNPPVMPQPTPVETPPHPGL